MQCGAMHGNAVQRDTAIRWLSCRGAAGEGEIRTDKVWSPPGTDRLLDSILDHQPSQTVECSTAVACLSEATQQGIIMALAEELSAFILMLSPACRVLISHLATSWEEASRYAAMLFSLVKNRALSLTFLSLLASSSVAEVFEKLPGVPEGKSSSCSVLSGQYVR